MCYLKLYDFSVTQKKKFIFNLPVKVPIPAGLARDTNTVSYHFLNLALQNAPS